MMIRRSPEGAPDMDVRERRGRRLIDRLSKEIMAREEVLDSPAIFDQILIVVRYRRQNGTIKGVQFRFYDDGED
jgi:hypothetical protein